MILFNCHPQYSRRHAHWASFIWTSPPFGFVCNRCWSGKRVKMNCSGPNGFTKPQCWSGSFAGSYEVPWRVCRPVLLQESFKAQFEHILLKYTSPVATCDVDIHTILIRKLTFHRGVPPRALCGILHTLASCIHPALRPTQKTSWNKYSPACRHLRSQM